MNILYAVNGYGLGNAIRNEPLIRFLSASGINLQLLASGQALNYFQKIFPQIPCQGFPQMQYGKSQFGVSLHSLSQNAAPLAAARRICQDVVREFSPDVMIGDSCYLTPFMPPRLPKVAINHSSQIVKHWQWDAPRHLWKSYLSSKKIDAIWHQFAYDKVLTPWFLDEPGTFRPLLRPGLQAGRPGQGLLLQLSGSGLGQVAVKPWMNDLGVHVDIVGLPRSAHPRLQDFPNITFHDVLMDNRPLLMNCQAAIVNSGFSAVSEMAMLGKPFAVLPLPNHPEQYVNARMSVEAGLALPAHDLQAAAMRLLDPHDPYCTSRSPVPPGSPSEWAEFILG